MRHGGYGLSSASPWGNLRLVVAGLQRDKCRPLPTPVQGDRFPYGQPREVTKASTLAGRARCQWWQGGTAIDLRWTWAQLGGSVRAQRSSEKRKGQALCPHCAFHQISIFTMWSTTSPTPGANRARSSCCTATRKAVRRGMDGCRSLPAAIASFALTCAASASQLPCRANFHGASIASLTTTAA